MGRLVIVPTPVGNLSDITLRALEVLKSADFVFAEDTRTSGNLLRHYSIGTPLKAFHQHNEHKVLASALKTIENSSLVALVSDAGTPGISDPGFLLIRACIEQGIDVECLPGPTALIPALVRSGFPTDRFCFEGFLPHKKGRQTRIKAIAEDERTLVYYESPHRLVKTLEQLSEIIGGDRPAAVIREISKLHEECRRASLDELAKHFKSHPPKGEIVLVLAGKGFSETNKEEPEELSDSDVIFGREKRKSA
jgi:16S rRNA (cytidine1402-2'-O)-methyltransferase